MIERVQDREKIFTLYFSLVTCHYKASTWFIEQPGFRSYCVNIRIHANSVSVYLRKLNYANVTMAEVIC